MLYVKDMDGTEHYNNPSSELLDYLSAQGIDLPKETFVKNSEILRETNKENLEIL